MKTISDANQLIISLLGRQSIKDETYRLMKYVIRADVEDGVLLHNVITGQLIFLPPEEAAVLDGLPGVYSSRMDNLIRAYYLVPSAFDEYTKAVQLRKVLHTIEDKHSKGITGYTILPTTACNARCFYCFEAGVETVTMTPETADHVIEFIRANHNGKKVSIRWFGGEPTVGHKIIDRISEGLQEAGIEYDSDMISNGFLFDENMADRAVHLWHLKQIQITLDGTEETYNKVKAYVQVKENPYRRVLRNIRLLLDKKIHVSIRMNLDRYNAENLKELLKELASEFQGRSGFGAYAWPVFADCGYDPAVHSEEDNSWLGQKVVEMNELSAGYGFYHGTGQSLPVLKGVSCMADNDSSIVIRPGGELVRCLEKFDGKSVVGDVKHGIINNNLYQEWKKHADYQICRDCVFFPKCVRLKNCGTSELCYEKDKITEYIDLIRKKYVSFN